ncbi:hypothetical protein KIW84_057255 [Lathyrus oleraceus]|uniref:Uncharacterized protein n=1 Tax=Pisum sativum TaxID=3888 RepID=A0A9D4X1P4_PEA|nr:hypothetical protein KIW84_057255 [Pisum sativum]
MHGDGKQHYFNGCALVFEDNHWSQMLWHCVDNSSYLGWVVLFPKITPCSYCGDGVEGDASPSPSSSIPANVAEDFLASGAEDDSASSLKGVHDCLAEDSLASSLADDVVSLCVNDASAQPSSPVNDAFAAQHSSVPTPPPPEIGLRRSSRARKENVKYSPSFSKNKKK